MALTIRRSMLLAALFTAAPQVTVAKESLVGEFGQAVLSCTCKGGKATHGYCGYHINAFSNEDKPWCRTKHGCGFSSIKGSWAYCNANGVERRRARDGALYSVREFMDFYKKGSKDMWQEAKPHVERRMARNSKAYSANEFRDYYVDALGEEGWISEWSTATPEQRQADDGKWYSWEEFLGYYNDKAWEFWGSAKSIRQDEL